MEPHYRQTIIIAEQYKGILEKHSEFLSRGELEVRTVTSNTEALVLQRKLQADLVVTSLDMPGMSGEELCRIIREDPELKDISIIIICSNSKEDLSRTADCRANAIVTTNTEPRAFADTARKLLNVSDRAALRVPVSVKVDGKDRFGKPFMGFSENISATGMLVESQKDLSDGDIVTCSFYLDNNTHIIINAEVVRTVKRKAEHGINQYGVKYSGLAGGFLDAIDSYIKEQKVPPGKPSEPAG